MEVVGRAVQWRKEPEGSVVGPWRRLGPGVTDEGEGGWEGHTVEARLAHLLGLSEPLFYLSGGNVRIM
jgi:hypothetical protein